MSMTSRTLPAPSQGVEVRQGINLIERLAICAVAFSVPAFNSHPFVLSSGFVCVGVLPLLLVYHAVTRGGWIEVPAFTRRISVVFAAWVCVAIGSTIANFDGDTVTNVVFAYVLPFSLFLVLSRLPLTEVDLRWTLVSFAVGIGARFAFGALVFYAEWGLVPLSELLSARYNVPRMQSYMDATFGNTGNSASLLAATLPLVFVFAISAATRWWVRLLLVGSATALVANILITSSRAAILSVVIALVLAILKLRTRSRYALAACVVIGAFFLATHAGDPATERFEAVLDADVQGDQSMRARLESVEFGWDRLLDSPLGVGPGMSYRYNPYSVSHEFAVAQGSELGVAGMVVVLGLAGVIIAWVATRPFGADSVRMTVGSACRLGAFSWMTHALMANIAMNSTVSIPWIGTLAICLALGEQGAAGGRV